MANNSGRQGMTVFPEYKTVSVTSLIPYARNSRTHSDAQVGQIAASIKEFGFLNPIIVDGESGIIAGHGRVLAAQKLGIAELPVIEAGHLSDTQRRAYIIADNKLAMNAGWDDEMLRVELDALGVDGFDLELTGFSLDEIQQLEMGDEYPEYTPESSSKEIDTDEFAMDHACPRCGFEFDDK
jgi:ParB-like chromosome segregation protein Spo0J